MAKKKQKLFPSQIRYREKNPIVSFRLKKEEKEKLEEIVKNSNTPVSKWVSDFVRGKAEKEDEKIKLLEENKALKDTIEKHREENENVMRFKVPCSVCGKDIAITPLDEDWDSCTYPRLKQAFRDFRHRSCG